MLDTITTLAQINDRIESLLKANGVTVVQINNGERFWVTDQPFREGQEADLVINGFVAERFPVCPRSAREPITN